MPPPDGADGDEAARACAPDLSGGVPTDARQDRLLGVRFDDEPPASQGDGQTPYILSLMVLLFFLHEILHETRKKFH